jgi:hypothetical protein
MQQQRSEPLKGFDFRMPFTDELVTELRTKGDFSANPPGENPIAMGKVQYAKWLTAHVYGKFPVKSLVTFKTIPIVLNEAPRVWFLVDSIQEMHYWATVDKETREPKAVAISLAGGKSVTFYPPSVLRPLVQSEVEAVDKLRNQTSSERVGASNGDTSIVSIDRSTGEITHEES